eukprot:gnl/MRDRNA2_/MRDRNA2_261579_c0_seq1.p1 gnl/MRDRNA2_/MRDRNA2_261579_c0~~gnl/MRDRNA2_/MRDRNA2_261579_c0_seq1.p1  ORF type:complete len:300 (+),score=29.53 gnl/MRDRNA2_/MRDRNA2_261579_c0_seq1:57-902(+)
MSVTGNHHDADCQAVATWKETCMNAFDGDKRCEAVIEMWRVAAHMPDAPVVLNVGNDEVHDLLSRCGLDARGQPVVAIPFEQIKNDVRKEWHKIRMAAKAADLAVALTQVPLYEPHQLEVVLAAPGAKPFIKGLRQWVEKHLLNAPKLYCWRLDDVIFWESGGGTEFMEETLWLLTGRLGAMHTDADEMGCRQWTLAPDVTNSTLRTLLNQLPRDSTLNDYMPTGSITVVTGCRTKEAIADDLPSGWWHVLRFVVITPFQQLWRFISASRRSLPNEPGNQV